MGSRIVRAGATVLMIAATLVAGPVGARAAGSARGSLARAVPSWATAGHLEGRVSSSARVQVQVVLGWRNADQLAALLSAVTDPSSRDYGHYLTPAEFRARFAPTAADVASATAWLRSQGMSVHSGPASHLWLDAGGTVSQIERAFSTTIDRYRVDGAVRRGPAVEPTVPAALRGVVTGVTGLDVTVVRPAEKAPPPVSITDGTPCSAYWGEQIATDQPDAYGGPQPYSPCGSTPQQLQSAYGVADAIGGGNDGSGVTVAVIDPYRDPRLVTDLARFSSDHGLPAPDLAIKTFKPFKGSTALRRGWFQEQALDVDAVHSMAPGADLVFVGAKSSKAPAIDHAMAWVLDTHAADLTTNSYDNVGESTPASRQASDALFQQAAAEGIGTYFSTGDAGDEIATTGHRTADYPASSPWVTGVGGTSLGITSAGGYDFETGWGDSRSEAISGAWQPALPGNYRVGGGGGTSRVYAEPGYQTATVPGSLSGYFGGSGRVVPDISIVADPVTGFRIGQTQKFPDGSIHYAEYTVGGTSLSSPLMAGLMALAQQRAGTALGFVNPALYAAYQSDPSIVHDIQDPASPVSSVRVRWVGDDPSSGVKRYFLYTMNTTGTLHTLAGYDDVTGIGSPNGEAFLDAFTP